MVSLARIALRRPGLVLLLCLLATAGVAPGLFRLAVRTDGAALYPGDDPTVRQTLADRARFDEPELIIVLVSARPGGPPVASPAGFRMLKRLHREVQALPGVERLGVRSLASLAEPPKARDFRLRDYLETVPGDRRAFAALLTRIRDLPLARGLFLSADGREAPIYAAVAADAERREVIADLEAWQARRRGLPFELRITGPAVAEAVLGEVVLRDLSRLVPMMIGVLILLLAVSLRTPAGVVIPLVQVLATLVWTFGLMGWAGAPVTLVTTILPVLLMAMAMTDEIHLLERLQHRLAALPVDGDGRRRLRQAASQSYADLASPLVLTSLTNAAGFLSFSGGSIQPLRDFGWFAGTGLLLALLSTFTLVPALLALLPPAWSERRRVAPVGEEPIPGWERLLARRGRAFAAAGMALILAAAPGVLRLRVQDSWIDNFNPRSPLVTAERDFNRAFWGSYRLDVVLAGDRRHFWTPAGAALLEELDRLARQAPHVGGVLGPLQFLEMGARTLGHPLPVSQLPPLEVKRTGAVVEVLNLRIDLRQYLTPDAAAARTRLFVRDADYARGQELRRYLDERLPALAARYGVQATISGDVPVGLAVVRAIVSNELRSMGWTAALIALTLLVSFRSLRWTLLVMTPVTAATLLLFGVLGWAGVPLGIATSMFAALTLGAGVDFALHYAHAYRRERRERRERRAGGGHGAAVLATLGTAGRGLLWNSLVLAFSFLVLAFSAIKPNASLGLLLAAAMLTAYGATVVFLPEMLRRWARE